MKYSGSFRRLFAFAIDAIFLIAIYIAFGLFFGVSLISATIRTLPMIGFWFYGGLMVTSWLYFACFESSKRKATIGKQLLGIQVTNFEGERLSFAKASFRYFLQAIIRVGVLLIFFTKKKQALHDKITRSVVTYNG